MQSITTNELIEAIRSAMDGSRILPVDTPKGFFTVNELAVALDVDPRIARGHLHRLREIDRLELTFVRRRGIDGRWSKVPAYKITEGL